MSAGIELQKAIYEALSADVALNAVITGVFDNVPDGYDSFPFVTIGEDVFTQWDTDRKTGFSASVTIHSWSRFKGHKETKTVQSLIYDVLHNAEFSYTGYDSVLCQERSNQSNIDPDGLTRHGVQTYNILMQKQ